MLMKARDNLKVAFFLLLLFGGCGKERAKKDNENFKRLRFIDFSNELVLSEGLFVDGIKHKDSLYLVYQNSLPDNDPLIELYSATSLLLAIGSQKDTVCNKLQSLVYIDNTLDVDYLDTTVLVTFFYQKKNLSPEGLDPILINMIVYYSGSKTTIKGKFPTHEDWDWFSYYETNLNDAVEKLPKNVRESIIHRWNDFVILFKKNVLM